MIIAAASAVDSKPSLLAANSSLVLVFLLFCRQVTRQKLGMAHVQAADDPFQAAFDPLMQDFRTRLKNDSLYREILRTKNIEEVYDVMDKLQEEQRHTGRLQHLPKMESFLNGLKGYSAVIEVFMQAKPDVLSLIWGPIKLILQWADVLKQSMVAIVDTTAEIGKLIPEFQKFSKIFGESTAIREVLVLFFKDILDFYIIALKFFSLPRKYSRFCTYARS